MGHCNHSLPSSVYHSPHVEHSLSLLLHLLWPQTTSLAFLYHWVWKASWSTAVLKNSMLQFPLWLMTYRTNLWIESVSGMDGAWWMLPGSTISSDLGKYALIIDGASFIAASGNCGVWTTIWPDFTFRKITFLMVPQASSIGALPCCL